MQHQQHPIYAHRASFFGPRPIRVDNTRIPGIASGVGRHDSIPDRFKIRRTGVLSHAGGSGLEISPSHPFPARWLSRTKSSGGRVLRNS